MQNRVAQCRYGSDCKRVDCWFHHQAEEQTEAHAKQKEQKEHAPKLLDPRQKNAQVVIVKICDQQPVILLQLRSSSMPVMPGALASVGGRRDNTDVDSRQTAVREVYEEAGLRDILTRADGLHKFAEGANVDWFVFLLEGNGEFREAQDVHECGDISKIIHLLPKGSVLAPAFGHAWVPLLTLANIATVGLPIMAGLVKRVHSGCKYLQQLGLLPGNDELNVNKANPNANATPSMKQAYQPFTVMCWNVLASVHTHYTQSAHGGKGSGGNETKEQSKQRHLSIIERIMECKADVVLLQEVDDLFLPREWQRGQLPCGLSLDGYTPYRSYSPCSIQGRMEGVAILLKNGVFERDLGLPKTALAKTNKRGWKCGMVVHARRCGSPHERVCFASVHLKWGCQSSKTQLLQDALLACSPEVPTVLGGDFNTAVNAHELKLLDISVFAPRRMQILPCTPNKPTVMGGRLELSTGSKNIIDHIYTTPHFSLQAFTTTTCGDLHSPGFGPWGSTPNDGSDHAWVLAPLQGK